MYKKPEYFTFDNLEQLLNTRYNTNEYNTINLQVDYAYVHKIFREAGYFADIILFQVYFDKFRPSDEIRLVLLQNNRIDTAHICYLRELKIGNKLLNISNTPERELYKFFTETVQKLDWFIEKLREYINKQIKRVHHGLRKGVITGKYCIEYNNKYYSIVE